MNDQPEDADNALPDWRDPFDEPRTIPGGWDVSGWTARPEPKAAPEAPRRGQLNEPVHSLAVCVN
jgi:hypothetical protein